MDAGKVDIRFVSGADGLAPVPLAVARARLRQRFAVVQDTSVRGETDMVFDRPLWRALRDFVGGAPGEVSALVRFGDLRPAPWSPAWQDAATAADAKDWDPPWALLRHRDGRLDLAMVADDWAAVGGPAPYHDSLTYAFYADQDVGPEVLASLEARRAAHWRLGPVQAASRAGGRRPRIAPGLLRRLADWR